MIAALTLAAMACLPTPEMHKRLSEVHGEAPAFAALSDKGTILEIWTAPNGSWTALVTQPDGTSCMRDFGKDHAVIPPKPPGDPA